MGLGAWEAGLGSLVGKGEREAEIRGGIDVWAGCYESTDVRRMREDVQCKISAFGILAAAATAASVEAKSHTADAFHLFVKRPARARLCARLI